jgi:Fur family transcriptional regulator, ferric uptake regulator
MIETVTPTVTVTRRLAARITARGRRLTRQRMIVAEALAASRRALSAQELHERLHKQHPHLGLATVYRALEAQVQDGMAGRLERPGHVSAYVACDPSHHHHIVCDRCQRVEDVAEDVIEPVLASVRRRHDFSVDHAALDFYGVCADCRRKGRG